MRPRTVSAFAALIAVLLIGGCSESPSPEDIAQKWCDAIERNDEAAAEALMSNDLRAAVRTARERDERFRAAHPSEKPLLGDGLRLTSYPDAVERCTVVREEGETLMLRMVPRGAPDGAWEDQLFFQSTESSPVIDDVGYAPSGRERLREWLGTPL